jgi:two-component system, LytTR family, sensor kinase
MKVVEFRYTNFILHILVWSLVLFLPYLVSDADNQYKIGPIPGLFFTLSGIFHMTIFYGNAFFLYPKLLNRTYWWLYIGSAVLLIVLSGTGKFYILDEWFSDSPEASSHVLFPSVVVFTVSIFYSIAGERIRSEKLQKENEALQLGMELKFLRSQISPHFLFNILTNFASLARKKSDHLEESLLMLSGLMRYMLYDAEKKISLKQEMDYLESFIALQRLRFGRDVKIMFDITIPNEQTNYCIEPMLLIPFVENAFKHGIGYMDQPAIDINLTVKEGKLIFQVKNKFDPKAEASKDECSGIGLNNVRSRLALLYPETHSLIIHNDKDLFCINLTLTLV